MNSVIDLVLAPSIRLMGRLKFAQKLALMGTVFLVAILILSWLVVVQINKEVGYAKNELVGATALNPLGDVLEFLEVRRGISVEQAAGDKTQQEALKDSTATVDTSMDALVTWSNENGASLGVADDVAALRAAWQKLRDGGALAADADAAAHDKIEEAVVRLFEDVSDKSDITLDPEMTTFYMGDTVSFRLPAVAMRAGQLRDHGVTVIGNSILYADDRSDLTRLNYTIENEVKRLSRNLQKVFAANDSVRADLAAKVEALKTAEVTFDGMVNNDILKADSISLPVAKYRDAGSATATAAFRLREAITDRFVSDLNARVSALSHKRFIAISACVLATLLALYLSAGFTSSLRASMKAIGDAADGMAAGKFPERVMVATQDEMREVARGIETVAKTLRSFSKAQTEIYDQHEAGAISYRIPSADFRGAYADMAEGVNKLVGSHIATKFELVRVVEQYARGDLSVRIERMPGEKAKLVEGVDGVRERMSAVRDEILGLSEAAARGEFSRRGDASKFEFAYKEMVEALNRLMANAEGGLNEVGKLLGALASGDLTKRMDGAFQGQFASLQNDANTTVEQLATIVRDIKSSSSSIDTAAKEIASGNSDLSARTEQQAASLEETASSMEELTATVKHNADNARQANQLAIGAGEVATKGGEIVGQVVGTMGGISASSKRIADIVGVIDGIAFQTNILALNAAVEAARAGEQGRGFAVVASEVRSLAQRSANAAKEIKGLIDESVQRVDAGSTLVEQAGKTMGEIVDSVKRVTDIMAEITAASAEQSAGIQQVNKTVTQMDEATQQNAALVEEASASARSMEEQASALWRAVETFVLDESRAAAAPAAKAAAAAPAPAPASSPVATAPMPPIVETAKLVSVERRTKTAMRAKPAAAPAAPAPERTRLREPIPAAGNDTWTVF